MLMLLYLKAYCPSDRPLKMLICVPRRFLSLTQKAMSTPALLFTLLLLAFLAGMAWQLFFRRRPAPPLAAEQRAVLQEKVRYYRRLSDEEKERFEQNVAQFLKDVAITGVEAEVTEADRLLVAASAVIPAFGFPGWRYRNLSEVLLYPDTFDDDFQVEAAQRDLIGLVGDEELNRMMILSLPALRKSFGRPERREHVGIHEFIHLLDKADGDTGGIPNALLPPEYAEEWLNLIRQEMEEIRRGRSDIDSYGATDEAEFLGVAAEYFFTQPGTFRYRHPKLYEMLSRIFRQEP